MFLFLKIILLFNLTNAQRLETELTDSSKSKYESYNDEEYKPHYIGTVFTEYEKPFLKAVNEMSQMIDGTIPVSFKRGVFLLENAYYKGELDWVEYCHDIDNIVAKVKPMINKYIQNGEDLAKNYSIFSYFHDSIPENNYSPFSYDFDTFLKDYNLFSHMTSNLMKTNKGNCMSLPFLYKIIANEIGAEAYISTAPMHFFIKIKDNDGNWFNHEVTAGSFSRTSFLIESFGITDRAIQSGLYLKPLSELESIGVLLEQLINFYEKRTGKYYGDVVAKAAISGLKARPVSLLLVSVINEMSFRIFYFLHINNLPQDNLDVVMAHSYTKELKIEIDKLNKTLSNIGYSKFTTERYVKLFSEVFEKIKQTEGEKND
jgi:hypothetical protein